MGYEVVEFYSPYLEWTLDQAKEARKLLDDLGLKCLSTHNSRIVHDREYTDGRVDTLKAARVDGLLADLRVGHESDDGFLAHGMVLFEALYLECELSEANDEPTTSLTEIPPWSNG